MVRKAIEKKELDEFLKKKHGELPINKHLQKIDKIDFVVS